jgi:hypothetical protein
MARADKPACEGGPRNGTRRGPGRPIQGREAKRRYQILLEPQVAEKLRRAGGGNLSLGIAQAADRI